MFKYIKGTKKLCRYPLLHRNCSCRILEIIELKSKERPQYSKIQMKNESKIDLNFAIISIRKTCLFLIRLYAFKK